MRNCQSKDRSKIIKTLLEPKHSDAQWRFVYLCEELSERLVVGEVTDVSGVEVVQRCDVCLVHLLLLRVHLI